MTFFRTYAIRFVTTYLVLALVGVPVLSFAQTTGATMSVSPAAGTYGVGKTFTVQILVESTANFNSASAKLSFDKELLSVQTVSKNSSALSLWAVEPSSSNTAGTIDFEGGNTAVLSGKKTMLSVTFKALKEGKAKVDFTAGTVLAADGKGTDIAGTKTGAEYEITASAGGDTPPPQPPPVPTVLIPKPDIPDVTSTTHPDEKLYYNAPKASFKWELPLDVTVVRMGLDTKDKTVPATSYDPAIDEKEFDQLTDGVMYFHLRYVNEAGAGPTVHKKILVDKTPPEPFTLETSVPASSTDVVLKFSATDTLSQLDRYEVSVDGNPPVKVALVEVKNGEYTLSEQDPGKHTIELKAFDKAGNSTSAEGKYTIEGEEPSTTKSTEDPEAKPTDWRLFIDIGLVAFIAFLIGYLWYERKMFRREKYIAKRESDELRDNMGNIFAALREEIGEQAGMLFQKPNPSAQDREVMENMNEAIDLSEELLSKEVEDVRKLLM